MRERASHGTRWATCITAIFAALIGCGGSGPSTLTGSLGFTVQSAVLGPTYYSGTNPTTIVVFLSTLTRSEVCKLVNGSPPTATASLLRLDFAGLPITPGDYPIQPTATPQAVIEMSRYDEFADGGLYNYNTDRSGSATLTTVSYGDTAHYATSSDEVKGTFDATLTQLDGGASALSGSFDAIGCP